METESIEGDDVSRPTAPATAAWLGRVVERAMPADRHESSYEHGRSHAFARAMLLVIVIQAVLLLIFRLDEIIAFAPDGRRLMQTVITKIVASQCIAMLAFRFTGSRTLAVQIVNLGLYIAMLGAAFSLGGPASPTLPILVLVPLFAALFSGARWSAAWTLVCVGTVVALRGIAESGFEFHDVMKPSNRPRTDSMVLCVIYLAIGFVVVLYERLNRRLREALASEREEFAYLADHDPLTGLNNRRSYAKELDRAFRRATRIKLGVALIAVDLDDFKPVNDELGHAAGDLLLQRVAERLHDCLRATDTVARVGGDEFAILLEHVDVREDVDVVLRKIDIAMSAPFEIDGRAIRVRASLGSAIHPEDGATPDALWRAADEAMYVAKRLRKARTREAAS